jgi:thioredoxin 2
MSATQLDDRGVIEKCPKCGQKNRVQFSSLGSVTRCGQCKTDLPPLASPIEINDEDTFESLTSASSLPVLVDFWADWCGPCKMMAPELSKVASNSGGKFVVAKVNTEGVPALAQRFKVSALPTLMLFKGGAEVGRAEGARPAVEIQKFVERSIRAS